MNRSKKPAKWAKGRKVVLIDIENALGFVPEHVEDVENVRERIENTTKIGTMDQVIIGVSHHGVLAAGVGWPKARLVVKSGADGADLALLDVLANEHVEGRFAEVVLVSGDHIFTEAISRAAGRGVPTTVLSRGGSLSRELRMAATSVALLAEHFTDESHGEAA